MMLEQEQERFGTNVLRHNATDPAAKNIARLRSFAFAKSGT
jgi:hypothetical protein